MELDGENESSETPDDTFKLLIQNLALNEQVICKSQQKDEVDLTAGEKSAVLTEMLEQNKANFLFRFGQFLNSEELKQFEQFQFNPETGYEITYQLQKIHRANSAKCIKNRRLSAVKRLSREDYFSEKEMRKRNPLLYDQLVGLYLSANEIKLRDMQERSETLVDVLMDGIDREATETKRIRQEEAEDAAMEEEDSSSDSDSEHLPGPSQPNNNGVHPNIANNSKKLNSRQFWGEIVDESQPTRRIKKPITDKQLSITAQERKLLRQEFYNSMYESFLEGKDDYDYSSIDNNEEYDNLEIINHDEEEKYFDSEEAENIVPKDTEAGSEIETSEDELDIYMNSLNQNPAVSNLAEAIKKL